MSSATPALSPLDRAPLADPAAYALVQQALEQEAALGEGLTRLVGVLSEQHARLSRQLVEIRALLGADSPGNDRGQVVPIPLKPCPPRQQPSRGGAPRVTVACLGGFVLSVDGEAVEQWRAGKARTLFQYLVLHRGQPVSRSTLIEALWPDPAALAAGTSLKVAVHALRQSLRDVPGVAVTGQESGYQLEAPGLWLDVDEFERLCRLGQQLEAHGQGKAAVAVYLQAAELYAGDFLPDVWDDWAVFRREGLKDQLLCALAKLADAALAACDWYACIRWCRQILEQDWCREDAFRLLMLAHGRLGQPTRVRRWFELCEHTLRLHLDCEPAPETVRVYQAAMRGGPAVGSINSRVTGA